LKYIDVVMGMQGAPIKGEEKMHLDLGVIDTPVLLFGGPYSNLQATQAVLIQGSARGIRRDATICTGDTVAYCANPAETVALMQAQGIHVVAGNCEKQLATGAGDCGCGFDAGSACDLLSAGWFGYAAQNLQAEHRRWMAACPDVISFVHHGARYAVIHGGVRQIARFVWPTSGAEVFDAEWSLLEALIGPVDHVIAGHCGLPFQRETARGRWINAGAIGMPANDGHRQTRYAILQEGRATVFRLDYDVEAAFSAMQAAGLTQGYHQALRDGYWPSEEVLPAGLRRGWRASG
jgi:predicted phosphodiesterase